jgi:transglutaminase-like putative cysteine protease
VTIRVAINHRTEYRFDRTVSVAPHVVRLRPAPHTRTPVHRYSLKVEPGQHFVNWQQDPFGNYLARFVFPERTRDLSFEVDLVAEMTVINPFDFFLEEHAERYPFRYEAQLARDLAPYLEVRERGPALMRWMQGLDLEAERATVDFLVSVNQRLQSDIAYTVRMEPGVQACEQTLERRVGSCRDSGWLLVQALRHAGLAARFVSGYLVQLAPDQEALDGPSGPSEDFTDLHAWAEVYLPGAGWVGLDPTSGLFAGEGHLPLACTPEPASAAPVSGATEPCEVAFRFHNRVTRIHEDPRVTRPLGEAQWQRALALGDAVDERLAAGDVRLTVGGEPTFVSIDDMDGAEWTVAALGEDKRRLAGTLVRRLARRFATGGVLHYGQGKWYPGEPLPRWSLTCLWRGDGAPVWRDPERLAAPGDAGRHSVADGRRFIEAIARRLLLPVEHVVNAYEDVTHLLWQEGSLPVGENPLAADLDDDLERRRLAARLGEGLGSVRGHLLPLAHDPRGGAGGPWRSARWRLRRERLYLLPGDSPMGLRLPLASLEPLEEEPEPAPDPFDERPPLELRYGPGTWPPAPEPLAAQHASSEEHVTTALCVEVRGGLIHVFLPPLSHLEHFLELVAVVEDTAEALDTAVVLEGYEPPPDPRLRKLQVTPDPGVIEVNVHPASSWRERVTHTEALYEEARQSRLGTEKFMLDGRHTGTGGGNHVTLGAARPVDSPLLRRPDLLASLVLYWQHHPSLSYLFSGAFIGPTSQAPRVDEARHESLYELEIALQQLDEAGAEPAPWVVDRALRHLLVDLTAAGAAAARPGGALLGAAVPRPPGALGHRPARSVHAAPFRVAGLLHRDRRNARRGACAGACLVRGLPRVPLSPLRDRAGGRGGGDPARGHRAVARARRGGGGRWHGALRGLFGGASGGEAAGRDPGAPRARLQRPAGAADSHRDPWRAGGRCALQGLAAALRAAPHHPRPRAAGLRPGGPGQRPIAGRMHLPRVASGRAQLRDLPGQRQRGRGAAHCAFLESRSHARPH